MSISDFRRAHFFGSQNNFRESFVPKFSAQEELVMWTRRLSMDPRNTLAYGDAQWIEDLL